LIALINILMPVIIGPYKINVNNLIHLEVYTFLKDLRLKVKN